MSADTGNPFEDQFNRMIEQYRALVQRFLDFGHLPDAFNDLIKSATDIRDLSSLTEALQSFRNNFFTLDLTANPAQVIQNLLGGAGGGQPLRKLPDLVANFTSTVKKLSDRNAQMMYSVLGNVIIPINTALATLETMGVPLSALIKSVKGVTEKVDMGMITPALEMVHKSLDRFLSEAEGYFKATTGIELQQSEAFAELLKDFQGFVRKFMDTLNQIGEHEK